MIDIETVEHATKPVGNHFERFSRCFVSSIRTHEMNPRFLNTCEQYRTMQADTLLSPKARKGILRPRPGIYMNIENCSSASSCLKTPNPKLHVGKEISLFVNAQAQRLVLLVSEMLLTIRYPCLSFHFGMIYLAKQEFLISFDSLSIRP